MTAEQQGVATTLAVISCCYAALLVAAFRHVSARTPAGIVRRLFRTGAAVTVPVGAATAGVWDPSRPLYTGGFYARGSATYTLVDSTTIRVRFQPRSGPAIERSGPIPDSLLPERPEARRRRLIARLVIGVYVAVGVTTFAVTASQVDGTRSLRIRMAALAALITVAVSWLVTHIVLTRAHTKPSSGEEGASPDESQPPRSRHLIAWLVGGVVTAAALGVAWRLSNIDQPHAMSWASAFLSAAIFVLVSGAALSASLHHHTYIHHRENTRNR